MELPLSILALVTLASGGLAMLGAVADLSDEIMDNAQSLPTALRDSARHAGRAALGAAQCMCGATFLVFIWI